MKGALMLVLLLLSGPVLGADLVKLWGPESFVKSPCNDDYGRCAGELFEVSVASLGVQPPYSITVVSGDAAGNHRVTSASITIDGQELVRPSDFKKYISALTVPTTLAEMSTLRVAIDGAPESYLSIYIEGYAPGYLRIAGPRGGQLRFANSVVLDVPAGAVSSYTAIEVTDLNCTTVDGIVMRESISASLDHCIGAFLAGPEGLSFQVPVMAEFPVSSIAQGEIPLLLEIDQTKGSFGFRPTDLVYDADKGTARAPVEHFSGVAGYVAKLWNLSIEGCLGSKECELLNELTKACLSCDTWSPSLCSQLVPIDKEPCCSMHPLERKACGFVEAGSCDCCTEKRVHVKSDFSLLGSGECEVVGDDVEVSFLSCPGQPTQTTVITDAGDGCPEDLQLSLKVYPDVADVKVDETAVFTAEIVGVNNKGEMVEFKEDSVNWFSNDESVASIVSSGGLLTSGQMATVRGISQGTTSVVAVESGTRLSDNAIVRVEEDETPVRVNIAFVVNNGIWTLDHFPPYGSTYLYTNWTDGWYAQVEQLFGEGNFDLSLVNYNRYNNPNGMESCGYNSASLDPRGYSTRLPFGEPLLRTAWNSAWSSLSGVCDNANPDMGNQLYSGVLHAVRDGQWEEDAFKAIVVLPKKAACYVIGSGLCDSEPGTGLTLGDVTRAASDAGIKLFVINSSGVNVLPECGGAGCSNTTLYCYQSIAARDMHKKMAEDTGGTFYNAWSCEHLTHDDAVRQVLQDIYVMSGAGD